MSKGHWDILLFNLLLAYSVTNLTLNLCFVKIFGPQK